MAEDRLKYLIMRCKSCKGFLTKLEIVGTWEQQEQDHESKIPLCPCGGRKMQPGNVTPEELAEHKNKWQWFRYYILRRRDKGTRLYDLWEKCIKGKELGELYPS